MLRVLCIAKSDYFPKQHQRINFYNEMGCVLCEVEIEFLNTALST
jgi:hypothetical protein